MFVNLDIYLDEIDGSRVEISFLIFQKDIYHGQPIMAFFCFNYFHMPVNYFFAIPANMF